MMTGGGNLDDPGIAWTEGRVALHMAEANDNRAGVCWWSIWTPILPLALAAGLIVGAALALVSRGFT